jgi:hypothetical protein
MIYRCEHGPASDLVASVVKDTDTWNQTVVLVGRALEGQARASLLVLFGYQSVTSCWFAGIDFTGELSGNGAKQVIGRIVSGAPVGVEYDSVASAVLGQTYRIQVVVEKIGGLLNIRLAVDSNPEKTVLANASEMYNGGVGAGGYGCDLEVLHFGFGSCGL